MKPLRRSPLFMLFLFVATALSSFAQGTAFTYQGRLNASGSAVNGDYEMMFTLYDAVTNGNVVGPGQTVAPVAVTNGLFAVALDFGAAAFNGSARWLEITVNVFGSNMIPTTLIPRQKITPTPYAIHAANSAGLMTFNNSPLDIKVNGERVLRLEPTSLWDPQTIGAPNVIGGSSANVVAFQATGATIGGGGAVSFNGTDVRNLIESSFATIGGGMSNSISTQAEGAVISGGMLNTIKSEGVHSTIGGGFLNIIQEDAGTATIGGGRENNITGDGATISGGWGNTAPAYGVVAGGQNNYIDSVAHHSTVGGGTGNTNTGYESVIGGGFWNLVTGLRSTVGGGAFNQATFDVTTIGGGFQNRSTGYVSTVAGGYGNIAGGAYSAVAGGQGNVAQNTGSAVAGGDANHAEASYSAIGGGHANVASGYAAVISGGGGFAAPDREDSVGNTASGDWSSVGGGSLNYAFGVHSVIGGGDRNLVETNASFATVAGGAGNNIAAGAYQSYIGGGSDNKIAIGAFQSTVSGGGENEIQDSAFYSTIGGGLENIIRPGAISSTIAGGFHNQIQTNATNGTIGGGNFNVITDRGSFATIGGGGNSRAGGYGAVVSGGGGFAEDGEPAGNIAQARWSTVSGGAINAALGTNSTVGGGSYNIARGLHATVPGGFGNAAEGDYSFAAGVNAQANHAGAFVWADAAPAALTSSTQNQFTVRASGGVRLFSNTNATTGVELAVGSGTWSSLSDHHAKENFIAADGREILDKVATLPLATWNYKSQDKTIRHIGPMAQDFRAAFGVGENERTITTVDADGVALAAIQGLNRKVEEKDARIAALEKSVAELKDIVRRLAERH